MCTTKKLIGACLQRAKALDLRAIEDGHALIVQGELELIRLLGGTEIPLTRLDLIKLHHSPAPIPP